MSRVHGVPALSLACVTALVNEWGTEPRHVSPRPWVGYPGPDSAERRLLDAEWAAALGAGPTPSDGEVVVAADAVHPVFAAIGARERARLLDARLESLGVGPRVVAAGGPTAVGVATGDELALAWAVPRRADLLAAAMVVALLPGAGDAGGVRLGTCAAADCADAFADVSPRQDRAYCSPRCQARERARARRAGGGRATAPGTAADPAQRVR